MITFNILNFLILLNVIDISKYKNMQNVIILNFILLYDVELEHFYGVACWYKLVIVG